MIAVDTNVIVRFLTDDDAKQSPVARALMTSGIVWIAKTVLLETEWVLRRVYRFRSDQVLAAFTMLLGLNNIEIEDESDFSAALDLFSQGLDLADAVHVCRRPGGIEFASFDLEFLKRAKKAGIPNIALP